MAKPASLPEAFGSLVARRFQAARQSQTLLFSSSELAILHSRNGVPFQLRYCPALAKKPGARAKDDAKPKPDPFENPHPDLLVAEVPVVSPSHVMVLNKYPVIPNHFILATKLSKPQTGLLEMDDLELTHACLQAWSSTADEQSPRQLFAFFNSGEHSGASQSHRHVQFLPVEDMREESDLGWDLLLNRMKIRAHAALPLLHDPSLPFVHYAMPLEPDITRHTLHEIYITLLKAAVNATRHPDEVSIEPIAMEKEGQTTISYNLAMTSDKMAICPRRSESAQIDTATSGGGVAINGTMLGGTLMVKEERDWQSLQKDNSLLDHMLAFIGHPMPGLIAQRESNKL